MELEELKHEYESEFKALHAPRFAPLVAGTVKFQKRRCLEN